MEKQLPQSFIQLSKHCRRIFVTNSWHVYLADIFTACFNEDIDDELYVELDGMSYNLN